MLVTRFTGVRSKFFRKAFLVKGTSAYDNHFKNESEQLNKAVLQGHTHHTGYIANGKRKANRLG